MTHYDSPAGERISADQLLNLVTDWRVEPTLTTRGYGDVVVVRDDLLPSGTKGRLLDALVATTDAEEFVCGSASADGLGIVALADVCRRDNRGCTLFLAARDRRNMTPNQLVADALGARIVWVPNGMLPVTTARAREYAAFHPGRLLLPIGLEHPTVVAAMVKTARALSTTPARIVSAGSSGVISRGLQLAFPDAEVIFVQTGHVPTRRERGRARVVVSATARGRAVDKSALPPSPSVATFDAKAWDVARRGGPCLLWKVGTDQHLAQWALSLRNSNSPIGGRPAGTTIGQEM